MIRNIIAMKVKPGKAKELAELYGRHFKALKAEGDRVASYEVYLDRNDDTKAYLLKVFNNDKDLQAHNKSKSLNTFLGELKQYVAGGADYHECTRIAGF